MWSVCVRQSENIKLDPELHAACKDDVTKHCAKVKEGNAAVSCPHFKRERAKLFLVIYVTLYRYWTFYRSYLMIKDIGNSFRVAGEFTFSAVQVCYKEGGTKIVAQLAKSRSELLN